MRVQLELYASLMKHLPPEAQRHRVSAEVPAGTTAVQLLNRYRVPLKQAHLVLRNGVYLAHASPREPVWEYILDANLAYVNFTYFDAPVCFVGHTHIPAVMANRVGVFKVRPGIRLRPRPRSICCRSPRPGRPSPARRTAY